MRDLNSFKGVAKIRFADGKQFSCNFVVQQELNEKIVITCSLPLSAELLKIVENEWNKDNESIAEAILDGTTSDNGNITIEKMMLNRSNVTSKKMTFLYDGKKIGAQYQNISPNDTGTLTFIAFSVIQVQYSLADADDLIVTRWPLTNFEFVGTEKSNVFQKFKDKFVARLGGYTFAFVQRYNYDEQMKSVQGEKSIITADAEVAPSFKGAQEAYKVLSEGCWLLSPVTSNWVVPVYSESFKNGELIGVTIYPSKVPYSFLQGKSIVDNLFIDGFLEESYTYYLKAKAEFGIKVIIEYYLAAIRQKTPEVQFLMGIVGLECLSSYVSEYAKRRNEPIPSKDREIKREKLSRLNGKLRLGLGEQNIDKISDAMSQGNVGTKDSLRYLFRKIDVPYSEGDLSVLFSIRGKVIHSGRYENIPDLLQKSDTLFRLLVTAVLRLLGWKGKVAPLRY